jgi:hypothetical protein
MRDIAAAVALALLAGCASGPKAQTAGGDTGTPAPAVSADAAAFVSAQAARVRNLSDFASRGSAELRWKDESGDHFEQAQVELAWRDAGERMALRADKLGERLAWAGGDRTRWWIFDLQRTPSRLMLGARGTVPRDSMLPFAGPEAVIELMAARPWPASARALGEQDGARWIEWSLAKPIGGWCASRALVTAPGALPRAVELLDASGAVLASAELSRPLSVNLRARSPGEWPDVAGTTRLRMAGGSGATWDIFWDAPGDDPARLKDRLFELETLRAALRPQEVVEQDAAAP